MKQTPQPASTRRAKRATNGRQISFQSVNGRKNGSIDLVAGTNGQAPPAANETKLRGGYYTPAPMARFLAKWAIRERRARVLEPSAGDGEFLVAAGALLGPRGMITAIELDPHEARRAAARSNGQTETIASDFFAWFGRQRPDNSFDAVVGNPPFIRYQDFPEEQRLPAFTLMRQEGLHPSRLTNAWLPFVVAATRALRHGGRLALVLPAELLQVIYAAELREYLARKYSHLTVITFRELVFHGIQEEIVLLLGVRQEASAAKISFVELGGLNDLEEERVKAASREEAELDHSREKWTQYYLSAHELGLIRELERSDGFCRLGHLAEVDVGIVTGRNEFFVLSKDQAVELDLIRWCLPLVGRSAQIPGLVLRRQEWRQLASDNGRCFLLQLGDTHRWHLEQPALNYVEFGEGQGYHEGYKCHVRLPNWWNVPSTWVPDAFLLRQIHDGPRIVQNRARATCTDTIHRVRTVAGIKPSWLAAASVNSLTFAFAEILGRSYGGGVLELEPTEAEKLPFPTPSALPIADLDRLARNGTTQQVLDAVDRLTLGSAGLSQREISLLRGIWLKLYERRSRRKRR